LAELKEIKRKTREKRKAYWKQNPNPRSTPAEGDVQTRVRAEELILGQIPKAFFNTNYRNLRPRVPQPKTTHLSNRFCLIEKKLDIFLRAESYFNLALEIERLDADGIGARITDYYGGKSLHEQSHGESFMALLLNRMVGEGLYLFNEPEAALSPQRQLSVLTRIHDLVRHNSQFIIATHSPILMAYANSTIYHLSAQGMEKIGYYDTEHYRVTHDFLVNPQRMLDHLLDNESLAPNQTKRGNRKRK